MSSHLEGRELERFRQIERHLVAVLEHGQGLGIGSGWGSFDEIAQVLANWIVAALRGPDAAPGVQAPRILMQSLNMALAHVEKSTMAERDALRPRVWLVRHRTGLWRQRSKTWLPSLLHAGLFTSDEAEAACASSQGAKMIHLRDALLAEAPARRTVARLLLKLPFAGPPTKTCPRVASPDRLSAAPYHGLDSAEWATALAWEAFEDATPEAYAAWMAGRAYRLTHGDDSTSRGLSSSDSPSAKDLELYPSSQNLRIEWEIGWLDEHQRLTDEAEGVCASAPDAEVPRPDAAKETATEEPPGNDALLLHRDTWLAALERGCEICSKPIERGDTVCTTNTGLRHVQCRKPPQTEDRRIDSAFPTISVAQINDALAQSDALTDRVPLGPSAPEEQPAQDTSAEQDQAAGREAYLRSCERGTVQP